MRSCKDLALRRPPGVIFDVGSLKSPLRAGLLALKSHGCKVTSVHPMFGPDTELLSGRHVVFVDLGNEAALAAARELFAPTMAEQVVMSLDEHDRLIAYVLGLSHALNIAFFTALAESGEAAPKLARMSSTTFDAQLDVASRVAQESPELYYEIQSLNDYGAESLEALSQAVERLRTAVLSQDHDSIRCVDAPRTRLSGGPAQRRGAPRLTQGPQRTEALMRRPQSEPLASDTPAAEALAPRGRAPPAAGAPRGSSPRR